MKVTIIGIPVRDQQKALEFYTNKLGFIKKKDDAMEGGNRWLTVVSKDDPEGPELLMEPAPLHFEPSKVFQEALYESGIPYTQFEVHNVDEEYDRLTNLGVTFTVKPSISEGVKYAVLDDTCGNLIAITGEI